MKIDHVISTGFKHTVQWCIGYFDITRCSSTRGHQTREEWENKLCQNGRRYIQSYC